MNENFLEIKKFIETVTVAAKREFIKILLVDRSTGISIYLHAQMHLFQQLPGSTIINKTTSRRLKMTLSQTCYIML